MCITIFAKERSISIEYASESVWLSKDGLMEIVVDLLITNQSKDKIDKLFCILPQRVLVEENNFPQRYKNKKLYEEITEDLINENSQYNNPIEKSSNWRQENDNIIISLELSDPNDSSKDIIYEGLYYGENTIKPFPNFSDFEHAILTQNKLTVFEIELGTEMDFSNPRWFRWKFFTLTGPLQIRNKFAYYWHKYSKNLYYSYSINGPGSVLYLPQKTLRSLIRTIRAINDFSEDDKTKFLNAYNNITTNLINSNLNKTETNVSFNDWRTRIYQGHLEPFTSIKEDGDVIIAGSQPNYISELFTTYYEWKSGEIHNVPSGKFTVRFLTKYNSRLIKLVPFIALILSIVGIILSYYSFGPQSN